MPDLSVETGRQAADRFDDRQPVEGSERTSGPQHELIVRVGGDGWLTLKTLRVLKNTIKMNLFDVYPLFNIEIVQGKGCHVWDSEGNEYLDLYGGHA